MWYLFLFIPLALTLAALQSAVFSQITVAGGRLDVIIIVLVMFVLYGSYELGLLAAIIIAPILDAIAGLPMGVSVPPLLSVILLAHWGGKTIFGARLGWPVIVTFLGVLLAGMITLIELYLLGWDMAWEVLILRRLLPSAFLNALAALAIYLPIILLNERQALHLE